MSDKSSKAAIDRIRQYLEERAGRDELFAAAYAKEGKSVEECFRYILTEARKRGTAVCMTDEEVFGLAVHYYDEDNIKVPATATGAKADMSADTEKSKVEAVVAAATNTGNRSAATVEGKESIAIVTGKNSKAKGSIGNWLVLTERDEQWHILCVKAVKVDGKAIKADTWYKLVNGKIIEG